MMTLRKRTAAPNRARRGFTIAEVMVAVMVLSVGVLAMASTAAVTGRQMNEGNTRNRAASVAQTRFETITALGSLIPGGCDQIVAVGGKVVFDSTRRGIRERWTIVRPSPDGTVTVYDTLTLPRVAGTMPFQSVIRCN